MSSEAEFLFRAVLNSPNGTFAVKEFSDRKQADSFRTRLYRVKSSLRDFTVDISVSGSVVSVKKAEKAGFKLFTPDNQEIPVVVEEIENTQWEKIKQETLDDIKDMGYSQELVDELLSIRKERFEVEGV